MKYYYWIVCPFFLFQNQFISAQTSSQKDEYVFIMGNVINRLYENYDSLIYAYQDYQEYAYIDSTKETKCNSNTCAHQTSRNGYFCPFDNSNFPFE